MATAVAADAAKVDFQVAASSADPLAVEAERCRLKVSKNSRCEALRSMWTMVGVHVVDGMGVERTVPILPVEERAAAPKERAERRLDLANMVM